MGASNEPTHVTAVCTRCGAVYAARRWPNGAIRRKGGASDCRCGCPNFVDLTRATDQ